MAPRSRSLGRQTRTAKLDQRRDRKRTIPTANAIRAQEILVVRTSRASPHGSQKSPARGTQTRGKEARSSWAQNSSAPKQSNRTSAELFPSKRRGEQSTP
jgi:hypothetical protein